MVEEPSGIDLGIEGLGPAVHIGSGGFADVYRAEQLSLRRAVAVKVLRSQASDPEADARFQRECHAIGAVSDHPHIIAVHHGGLTSNGRAYLVMEYFPGGSLADRLRANGPMAIADVVATAAKISRALAVAHRAGVLHRDVKPANIMISTYGEPALGDFGIARIEGGHQTVTGLVTASIVHAAPEVLEGHQPTTAADIYSLGSTMFELAVGRAPYYDPSDESMWPVMKRILSEPMPTPESVGFSPALGAIFRRATARNPAERYQDAEEVAEALTGLLHTPNALVRGGGDVAETMVLPTEPIPQADPHPRPGGPIGIGTPGPGGPPPQATRLQPPVGAPAGSPTVAPPAVAAPSPVFPVHGPAGSGRTALDGVAVMVAAVVALGAIGAAVWTLLLPALDRSGGGADTLDPNARALTVVADGPLRVGSTYELELADEPPTASYRLVIDGEPVGDEAPSVPTIEAQPGRRQVQVDVRVGGEVARSAPLDIVAISEAQPGFRAHLARVPAGAENLPTLEETAAALVAEGHGDLDLLATDELVGVAGGGWLITVPGFDDGSAAEEYCASFGLPVPERCYAARVEPVDR